MKITFVLPFVSLTGGIKSIFHLALELKKRGHIVKLVYPLIPLSFGYESYRYKHLKERARKFKKALFNWKKVSWFNKIEPLLFPTPSLHNSFIPDGDVVIATAWPTVYYVYTYKSSKGKKLYYIQDYEIWSGPKNLVDSSYRLPIQKITTSSTLENILSSIFGEKIIGKVPYGVDVSEFYRKPGEKKNAEKILMQYNPIPRKGFEDGIKAFEIAKREFPEIKLVMFGYFSSSPIMNRYEYHRYIYGESLRKLYSTSNIFLFPSREEGWGMPPMESMACGCPVVATSAGGIPDYTIPSETCMVSPPSKPEALADNLILLLKNQDLREKIATRGEEYIKKNFTWQKSAQKMEAILINFISN